MLRSSKRLAGLALQIALLLALAGVGAGVAAWMRGGLPHTPPAEPSEVPLAQALAANPLWIDTREQAAYEAAHIPGALLLNETTWEAGLPAVLEKWEPGRTAVVYCDTPAGAASHEVAERLREFKLGPVWVLQGGWKAWTAR